MFPDMCLLLTLCSVASCLGAEKSLDPKEWLWNCQRHTNRHLKTSHCQIPHRHLFLFRVNGKAQLGAIHSLWWMLHYRYALASLCVWTYLNKTKRHRQLGKYSKSLIVSPDIWITDDSRENATKMLSLYWLLLLSQVVVIVAISSVSIAKLLAQADCMSSCRTGLNLTGLCREQPVWWQGTRWNQIWVLLLTQETGCDSHPLKSWGSTMLPPAWSCVVLSQPCFL